MAATRSSQPQATSQVIRALEGVWGQAMRLHPDLPAVRFALPSIGTRARRWGHHTTWEGAAGEVAIYPAALLDLDPGHVLGVVLHEAAHALARARDVRDTAPTRRLYHNSTFANLAAETGLYLTADRAADIGADTPAPATLIAYKDRLKTLATALTAYRAAFAPKGSDDGH